MRKQVLTYLALGLGTLMVLAGLLTFFTSMPKPEIATAGVTLMLASGLIGSVNGKGK